MVPDSATSLFQRVIEDCTVAINSVPDSLRRDKKKAGTSMYNMRGTSFYYLKQYEKALNDFNTSVFIDSTNPDILNFRGIILFNNLKDYNKALADFTSAIHIQPKADYYLNRSRCYYVLRDLVKARKDVQSAMDKGAIVPEDYRKMVGI
jgi:tetratricopeptide (TPR) repeat protein